MVMSAISTNARSKMCLTTVQPYGSGKEWGLGWKVWDTDRGYCGCSCELTAHTAVLVLEGG